MKPFAEVQRQADAFVRKGGKIYQTWRCLFCGETVIANTSNYWTELGHHESCGHITNLRERGCDFVGIASATIVPMRKR